MTKQRLLNLLNKMVDSKFNCAESVNDKELKASLTSEATTLWQVIRMIEDNKFFESIEKIYK